MTTPVAYGTLRRKRFMPARLPDLRRRHAHRAPAAFALCASLGVLGWAGAPAQALASTSSTFTSTGAEQTFTVPGGVHSVHVVGVGGAGGVSGAAGGFAAQVTAEMSVTPGQTLYVEVGGAGMESGAGGFNGGAAGGSGAAGGGGASDVRTSPRSDGLSPDDRLIVAAGGGGGGGTGELSLGGAGGAAGSEGAEAPASGNTGGGAGTETTGGTGGSGCGGAGSEGLLGSGGAGSNGLGTENGGGGGGGGLFGGGGGSGGCSFGGGGGGGGSSLVPAGGSLAVTGPDTPPEVQFTYTLVPPTIAITTPVSGATYTQGEVVDASYSCTPPEGTTVEFCEGSVADGSPIDTSALGSHAFKVEAKDKDGAEAVEEVSYTVVAAPTIAITSPANGAVFNQDQVVKAAYSCTPAGGTAVKSCEGPVANGAAIDTSTLGPHGFEVEAEDEDGGMATKEVTYMVVASPTIAITTPAAGATYTQGQSVTAIYSCTPAGGTGLKTCSGPVANGAAIDTSTPGSHSFTVNAEDTDGGTATKAVSYTIVAAPAPATPDTILGSHPKKTIKTKKKKVKVKFSFSSMPAGANFECKLDEGAFAPCTSPKTYKVKPGKHTFSVEATSAAGTDPTPATFAFKVKKKH